VNIADLDIFQGTSFNWQARRLQNQIEPVIPVERFASVDQAVRACQQFDLLIIDAPPNSTAATLRIARAADIVLLPTGLSLDDMQPSALLAHERVKKGVSKASIAFALCRVG
jgi:chromosome partitioning protein